MTSLKSDNIQVYCDGNLFIKMCLVIRYSLLNFFVLDEMFVSINIILLTIKLFFIAILKYIKIEGKKSLTSKFNYKTLLVKLVNGILRLQYTKHATFERFCDSFLIYLIL